MEERSEWLGVREPVRFVVGEEEREGGEEEGGVCSWFSVGRRESVTYHAVGKF